VPVPAAVFVRGNQLWIAFAAKSRSIDVEPATFSRTARHLVRAVRQEPHATATLFQLSLNDAVVTGVDRVGGQWRVRLAAAGLADALPAALPTLRIEETDEGIRLPDIDAVLSFRDPVVGDRLQVGLAEAPTGASWTPRRFVGLRLLPALQGAVWQQLVEGDRQPRLAAGGLVLGPREGVLRTVPGSEAPATALLDPGPAGPDEALLEQAAAEPLPPSPLAAVPPPDDPPPPPRQLPVTASVTAESARYEAAAVADAPARGDDDARDDREAHQPRRPGPLGLWRFAETPDRPYWELRAALLQAANRAEVGERQAVQLDLARLHVANGLGAEAVSLLAGMLEPLAADGGGEARPAYRALDGAALLLAGRPDEALARLADAALIEDDETALWRGAARAALHDWDAALADWRRGEAHLAGYPPLARAALAEHGVMLLLQTGQIDEAFAMLDRLAGLPLPQARRDRLRLLEATALERDGALDEARVVGGPWRTMVPRSRGRRPIGPWSTVTSRRDVSPQPRRPGGSRRRAWRGGASARRAISGGGSPPCTMKRGSPRSPWRCCRRRWRASRRHRWRAPSRATWPRSSRICSPCSRPAGAVRRRCC
jgi:tetratricopeptide (TPR) repeat protein